MDATKTGSFIAGLRKELGLTQKELAQRLLVSDKAISRWEAGHGMPGLDNLEALAGALDVSIAELLRGERIVEPVEPEEADELAAEGLGLASDHIKKHRFQNIAAGFLAGLCIVVLAVVHLTAPIALPYTDGIARVDELSDGMLVAISAPNAAGIDVSTVDGETFINVYDTRWRQLTQGGREMIALVGSADETKAVLYYPGEQPDPFLHGIKDDVVLYGSIDDGGVATLPRLIYNNCLVIGIGASIVGLAAWALVRKRWFGMHVLKVALVPVCFTVALTAVLWGHFNEIYDATYYLSGILLLAAALYALALLVLSRVEKSSTA